MERGKKKVVKEGAQQRRSVDGKAAGSGSRQGSDKEKSVKRGKVPGESAESADAKRRATSGSAGSKAGRSRVTSDTVESKAGRSRVTSGTVESKAGRSRATSGTVESKAGRSRATSGPAGSKAGKKSAKAKVGSAESTEERIKEAARKLFTKKGFAATRTRDIAQEAGINLALLNYYFRSKEKLFDLVMMENFRKFLNGLQVNFLDPTLTMEARVDKIVTAYIDFLTEFPDLPLFILNEIRGNPSKIAMQVNEEVGPMRSQFFKELMAAKKDGRIELEPFHFVANLVGLTVFPFVGRPLLQRVTNVTDEQFDQLMQERKKLIPIWIRMMLMPVSAGDPGKKK